MHKVNIFLSLTGNGYKISLFLISNFIFQVITKEKQMQKPTIHFLDLYYPQCHPQTIQKDHKTILSPGHKSDKMQFQAEGQGFQTYTKMHRESMTKVILLSFGNNIPGVLSSGSDSMSDLLARQNYWDSSLGYWPTHTVSEYRNNSKENIFRKCTE